jgi:hypothetical protein
VSALFWCQSLSGASIFLVPDAVLCRNGIRGLRAVFEGPMWTGELRANDEGGVVGAKVGKGVAPAKV